MCHVTREYQQAVACTRCSPMTIRNWEGRVDPLSMSGNDSREALTGTNQLFISIRLIIYPNATTDQICAVVHTSSGGIYSRSQITNQCNDLEISRKRASKEAYDILSAYGISILEWYVTNSLHLVLIWWCYINYLILIKPDFI